MAKTLAEWTVSEKFREAVLVGGLSDSLRVSGDDALRIVPTNAFLRRMKTFKSGLHVAGPSAIMLAEHEMRNFPAIAILPYAALRPDPKAAAVAIKNL